MRFTALQNRPQLCLGEDPITRLGGVEQRTLGPLAWGEPARLHTVSDVANPLHRADLDHLLHTKLYCRHTRIH